MVEFYGGRRSWIGRRKFSHRAVQYAPSAFFGSHIALNHGHLQHHHVVDNNYRRFFWYRVEPVLLSSNK